MKRYVVDTQCVLWYLAKDRRLPKAASAQAALILKQRGHDLADLAVLQTP